MVYLIATNHFAEKPPTNMVKLQTVQIPAFQQYTFWCHQYSIVTDKYEAMENVCDAQLGIEVGQRQQKWSWKTKLFMVKIHV